MKVFSGLQPWPPSLENMKGDHIATDVNLKTLAYEQLGTSRYGQYLRGFFEEFFDTTGIVPGKNRTSKFPTGCCALT